MKAPWRSLDSGPLEVRSFRLLAGGQFASTIGDYCYAVALPWLVLSTHGGAILLGIVLACYGVPRTCCIPVGGVLADKVGPRTLMLAADAIRCVLVAALAVLAARHIASLAALGPIAALIGAGEGLFIPASFAIMPSLLDEERLTAGNALSTAAVQAGSLLGPALGGALVAATRRVDRGLRGRRRVVRRVGADPAADPAAAPRGCGDPRGSRGGRGGGRAARRRRRAGCWRCCGGRGSCRSSWWWSSRPTWPAAGWARSRCPRWRTPGSGRPATARCWPAWPWAGSPARSPRPAPASLRAPVMFASAMFLIEAVAIALVPYFGGEPGAAAALCLVGACNGLGNVIVLTVLQKWVSPGATRPGDGDGDALRVRQLPAVGGGVRGAGPPPRPDAVLPGGRRADRGGHPGRADAAGVPGVRGTRRRSGGECA